MNKITKVEYKADRDKYWIYIDGNYCTSIRARTFQTMDLKEGDVINCDDLKEKESFFWKNAYQNVWEDEKVRLKKVEELILKINPKLVVEIKGFGANTTELIKEHPEEHGVPDLTIALPNNEPIMFIEVTGTSSMRGESYWVRPDKLEYAKNHPDQNVWVVLHYQKPVEKFVFIKPNINKNYQYNTINIRGAGENFVEFWDNSEEVKSLEDFAYNFKM